jgi:hypothetical protein
VTIHEILVTLQAKLVQLSTLRNAAAQIGNIDQMMKYDSEINETTSTVEAIKTLL